MRRLVERLGYAFIDKYLILRKRFDFLPHMPTLILSSIFWWFYQVYSCGYLAFVEGDPLLQTFRCFIVCGGIGMVASSVYATTLQRYPIVPAKFSVGPDFENMDLADQEHRIKQVVELTGANPNHVSKVCETCRTIKTERTHHCGLCDVCTPRMDHHCVALNKCIHYKNQKQFVLFFFWMCFSLAVAMWSFHPYIMQEIRESEKLEYVQKLGRLNYFTTIFTWFYSSYLGESRLLRNLMIAIMAISSMLTYCIFAIFSLVFVNFMWFCVIRNGTIVACNKSVRSCNTFPWVYFEDSKTRCFRKPTILENIQVIFGKDWRFWLIPLPNPDSDGWLHRCACNQNDKCFSVLST